MFVGGLKLPHDIKMTRCGAMAFLTRNVVCLKLMTDRNVKLYWSPRLFASLKPLGMHISIRSTDDD